MTDSASAATFQSHLPPSLAVAAARQTGAPIHCEHCRRVDLRGYKFAVARELSPARQDALKLTVASSGNWPMAALAKWLPSTLTGAMPALGSISIHRASTLGNVAAPDSLMLNVPNRHQHKGMAGSACWAQCVETPIRGVDHDSRGDVIVQSSRRSTVTAFPLRADHGQDLASSSRRCLDRRLRRQ